MPQPQNLSGLKQESLFFIFPPRLSWVSMCSDPHLPHLGIQNDRDSMI